MCGGHQMSVQRCGLSRQERLVVTPKEAWRLLGVSNSTGYELLAAGEFTPPRLTTLERALELALNLRRGRVFADTWNLEQFSACAACLEGRRERLHAINVTQQSRPIIDCPVCGGS